jgi:serine/threonine protein kinase
MELYEKIEDIGKGKCIDYLLSLTSNLIIGSFGKVTKIRRKIDGRIMVWKELNYGKMNEKEKQQIVAEVNILRELKHPNIVRYYDRSIDKQQLKIYIIMEYCQGGDL